jgi:hypothetical protein
VIGSQHRSHQVREFKRNKNIMILKKRQHNSKTAN